MSLKAMLPPKIFDIIDRVGICTVKQILISSPCDIKKITNLKTDDIELLKNIAADCVNPASTVGNQMVTTHKQKNIPSGVLSLDYLLHGGYRTGIITELYGESGSGKTQLGLQAAIHNWSDGSVYICTEDLFPMKRFEQLKKSLPNYNSGLDYGQKIFVEHITEPEELLSCVRVRLPKLLNQSKVKLIVIDSVAAPFRTEGNNYMQRADDLRDLAINLLKIAKSFNVSVLCINQVTSSFEAPENSVIPCLGLAWANMINTRLWLQKTSKLVRTAAYEENVDDNSIDFLPIRRLSVVFSPYLDTSSADFVTTSKGAQNL